MAKKNAEILPAEQAGTEFTDHETGEVVTLTEEDRNQLILAEQQLAWNWIQFSLSLKIIRDRRLYLFRSPSLRDYCIEHLRLSPRHIYRHLQVADTFSETTLKKISKSNVPMTNLLQLARDESIVEQLNDGRAQIDDDRVVYADGTSEPLAEALERVREAERKTARKKLDDVRDAADKKDILIKDYRERIAERDGKIDELKKTIQELATHNDVDPERYVFVTQKKEALEMLDQAEYQLLSVFSAVNAIPHELLDSDLTFKLGGVIAAIEAGAQRVREQYGVAVWLPGKNNKPGDLVPE